MISLPFITLILLTGYCILDKKAPKQVCTDPKKLDK